MIIVIKKSYDFLNMNRCLYQSLSFVIWFRNNIIWVLLCEDFKYNKLFWIICYVIVHSFIKFIFLIFIKYLLKCPKNPHLATKILGENIHK